MHLKHLPPPLRKLAFAAVAALYFSIHASAHDDHSHTITATGIVYEDFNANGQQDPAEPGVQGVRVSNGVDIVRTDKDGRYEIGVSADTIVFVIKPRGFTSPLNEDNLPQFYYNHKPAGSPADSKFAGVAPTGPLPESIDFPLLRQSEPNKFKAIMFGDPQPRNITEVEYIAHDVIEQIIAAKAHDASFGVTLGDIVFDDLAIMEPLNQAIALIGIPWYNVIGNHDMNLDAPNDRLSDETFERHYGPSYYSFDHGSAHFLVLDDVEWIGKHDGQKAHYHGGLGQDQLEFIRNDLALIPERQLVVLMMHIPLTDVDNRRELYSLIQERPATVSISAHTHYMEHRLIGAEDGWQGKQPHHHIVNVTVCGSWWRGQPDERGIPHATMSDGGPNGYTIMEFDGDEYSLAIHPAGRTADYQMNIYAPETVSQQQASATKIWANVFAAEASDNVEIKVGPGEWLAMTQKTMIDPAFIQAKQAEMALPERRWTDLPGAHPTPHMFWANLPGDLSAGTHRIRVRWTSRSGKVTMDDRIIRISADAP